MSMPDDFQGEAPQKQGMSTTAKVLLIFGCIAGVCMLACCGGGIYLYTKGKEFVDNIVKNPPTNNPDEIRARTARVLEIEIPDNLTPTIAVDLIFMKQFIYGQPGNAIVQIIEVNQQFMGVQGAAGGKEQRRQMLRQIRDQQKGQQFGSTELVEESSESREFTIDGQKVEFEFVKGTSPNGGAAARQVLGTIQGREGLIVIVMMFPESEYDEAEVVKMIESIHLPKEGPPAVEMEETEDSLGEPESRPATEKADASEPAPDSKSKDDTE